MFTTLHFIFIVAVCTFGYIITAKLPSNFQTCRKSDSNFEECLRSSVENAFAGLANGYKEFGISPMEPLVVNEVTVEQEPGPISLYQKYRDIRLSGLSTTKVTKFILDLNNCQMYLEVRIPSVRANAAYEFKGQILVFEINAEGNFASNIKNVQASGNATCEIYEKDKVEYIRIVNSPVTMTAQEMEFQLGDIIPGNKLMSAEVQKALNEEPAVFFEVIHPSAEGVLSALFKDVANKVFTKVPMSDIFKD